MKFGESYQTRKAEVMAVLRKLHVDHGFTYREIAEHTGHDDANLSRWARGGENSGAPAGAEKHRLAMRDLRRMLRQAKAGEIVVQGRARAELPKNDGVKPALVPPARPVAPAYREHPNASTDYRGAMALMIAAAGVGAMVATAVAHALGGAL